MTPWSLRLATAASVSVALAQDSAAFCTDATLLQVHLPQRQPARVSSRIGLRVWCDERYATIPTRSVKWALLEFPSQHQWSVFCQHASCQALFLELRQIQFPAACRYFGVDSPKIDFVDGSVGSLCAPFHYD